MVKFLSLFVLLISFIQPVLAEEHEAPVAEEKEAPTAEASTEIVTPVSPWLVAENKVQELSARIKSKRGQIEDLLVAKQQAKDDSAEVKTIVDTLLKEHKELSQLVEEYEKNLNLLKYRFPERSAKNKREYKKIELQTLDDIENDMGVDGKLSRNLQRMRTHYGTTNPAKKRVPASVNAKKGSQKIPEGSIENPAPIVIKK